MATKKAKEKLKKYVKKKKKELDAYLRELNIKTRGVYNESPNT
jgi:hypothetical protein